MKLPIALLIGLIVAFGVTESKQNHSNTSRLSTASWAFVPTNAQASDLQIKLGNLYLHQGSNAPCCNGTYIFQESATNLQIDTAEAIYIPAIGGQLKSISINGKEYNFNGEDFSSVGPILRLPSLSGDTVLKISIELTSFNNPFAGLWKGSPLIGPMSELISLRDKDKWQQSTMPAISAVLFGAFSVMFFSLYFASKRSHLFYFLFGLCLFSWSLFYMFLSGIVRELDYGAGSRLHLVARSIAWIGTWALTLSYIYFSCPDRRQIVPKYMRIGLIIGATLSFVQLSLGALGFAHSQWLLFSLTSTLAFTPMVLWNLQSIRLLSFGYLTFLLSTIAFIGNVFDSTRILTRIFTTSFSPPVASRYTFPLLLAATAFIYVMHFARVLRRLRTNNQRLKRLNQSALVLSGTSFEPESLNEFATSLRKAMKTRRCCVAKRYSDGDYRVVGLSGILPEAFGEQIDLENNPFIKTAIKQLRPEVGTVKSRNEDRYKSMSFAVVPVTVQEHVEYLLLFSDPIKERTFSRSDLLYMRQFGLMMASSSERFESDLKFKQVVGHLDESLYNFVLGKSKKINLPDDHVSQWRGVGFFDQSSFVKSSNQVSQSELIMMVDIVKQWAAPIVMRHGGKIRSFGGDAYLFDITPLHEESKNQTAIRLSKALWDLCENQTELNRSLMTKALAPIAFRFGGHVGIVDDVSLFDLGANVTTIIGTTVNLAQRIQSVAAPATILVSQEVAELIDSTFKFSLSWNDKMKDFSPSLTLYRLDALKVPSTKSVADSETKSAV